MPLKVLTMPRSKRPRIAEKISPGYKSLWAKRRCVVSNWQFFVGGLQHLKFMDHELSWSSCFCLRILLFNPVKPNFVGRRGVEPKEGRPCPLPGRQNVGDFRGRETHREASGQGWWEIGQDVMI